MFIIYDLKEVDFNMKMRVGGKAASLGEMLKIGINVPKGFVCCNNEELNEEEIYNKYDQMDLNIVAVRSSAVCEDSDSVSFAGQFSTYLNTNRKNLIKNIKRCMQNNDENLITYSEINQIRKEDLRVSVIVQEMCHGDISGVLFTKNPINQKEEIVIEAVYGIGESLVQGDVTPGQYIYDIREKRFISQRNELKNLSEEMLLELIKQAMKIQEHYQKPQDIEWTIKDERIYILQARPITR